MYHRPEDVSNVSTAGEELVSLVGSFLGVGGPRVTPRDWEAVVDVALRNRMAPLVHRLTKSVAGVPDTCRARLRDAATQSLIAASSQTRALPEIADCLSGCPWVLLRGPVLGALLYDGMASRPFIDLDILVARDDVPHAARVLRQHGFLDHDNALPDAYYLRHHLHLHLVRSRGAARVNLELHWAIDHPFRLVTEDVPGIIARAAPVTVEGLEVPAPAPVDLLLTLAQHTVKHVIDLTQRVAEEELLTLVERGELLHLLDIALLVARRRDTLDRDAVRQRAAAWGVATTVKACLDAVAGLWPDLPTDELREVLPAVEISLLDRVVARSLAALPEQAFRARRRAFFRPARLVEAIRYVMPAGAALRSRYGSANAFRRISHALGATAHLILGGMEFAYYSLVARFSPFRRASSRPPTKG